MRSRSAGQLGFTLAEMVVVTMVLLVIAALIAPNVVAFERSREAKALEGSIARLPAEARNAAIKQQVPVAIVVQGDELVMETVPPQSQMTINSSQTSNNSQAVQTGS